MSTVNVDDDQRWVPTHVQVTVLRGRGLRAKGKHGTSDVYTIIQVGKEKYSTCVVEKTTSPEWKEECSFELLPGVLEDGGRSAYPPGSSDVILTVMHRAVIGLDVFLGQAVIPLDKAFQDNICMRNEWYKLNSKTGKKEKERGDIQVTIQFMRNNLTASMYNLSIKDKQRSAFGKLKDRMRGKKRSSEEDSSSAVLPAGYGVLRARLPSDGGGEEEYEDDEGGEGRRSKMRNFFLRGKLRKSSDTRSSTSLGSESSESSSRGGSLSPTAGISVVVSDLSNSPSNSSNLTDNSPEHTAGTSPQLSPHKCDLSQETGEISFPVPPPPVNGNHLYNGQSKVAVSEEGSVSLRPLQKSLPLSVSLQNLRVRAEVPGGGRAGDGRRWSFDKAGEEEKAAIAAALEQAGVTLGEEEQLLERVAATTLAAVEADSQGRKQGRNVFALRGEESAKGEQSQGKSEQAGGPAEEKQKGWFGSKDSHSKPSLMGSTKLEPSSESPTTPHPPSPWLTPSSVSLETLRHTNPFCPSQNPPTPMSPSNPFLPLLQCNPFYNDMLADKAMKPSLPPLPYPSSSAARPLPTPPCSSPSNPHPTLLGERPLTVGHCGKEASVTVRKRPLPPIPSEDNNMTGQRSSNPFSPSGRPPMEQEVAWDDSFEAFAANRLKSPEEADRHSSPQETVGQHTAHPLLDAAAGPWTRDGHLHHPPQNVNSALHTFPTASATLMASTTSSSPEGQANHMKLLHTQQHDMSTHVSPAQNGLEAHLDRSKTTNPAATSPKLMSSCDSKTIILTANTVKMTTNAYEHPNTHPSLCSPNPHLELEHVKVTSSAGLEVDGLVEEEVTSSPYPVGEDRLVEEEVISSPGPVGVDRLVEEEVTSKSGPVGVDRLVEEEVTSSPGPVGVDGLVEEEVTSSPGPVGEDRLVEEEEVTSSPGPVGVNRLVEEEVTSSPGPVGVNRLVEEEVTSSPGPVGVNRLVEEEVTSSPGPVGVNRLVEEEVTSSPGPVGVNRLVEEEVNSSPGSVGVNRLVEEEVTSSPGPVGVNRLVEEEVTSSPGSVGEDRLVEEEVISSPGPVGEDRLVEEVISSPGSVGKDRLVEEEVISSTGPLGEDTASSETGCTAPISKPRLGVSPQRLVERNPNLKMKDSVDGSAEEVNLSNSVITDNIEANASVSEDDHSLTTPSFYIMTSSPGDGYSLRSSPLSLASGIPNVIQGPPKPARLFSNSLNSSQIRTSPSQGFDSMLLNLSPDTPSNLYESVDSQQYLSCRSQQSSRASSLSIEGPRMETLHPTLPSQDGVEIDSEVGAWPAASSENAVPWELEEHSEGCRVSGYDHIQTEGSSLVRIRVDEERDAALQPCLKLEVCPTEPPLETPTGVPSDGSHSPPGDEKEGVRGTQFIRSNDHHSEHSPLLQLHRSLSEGTVTVGLQDLASSFGSDPGVNLDTSSVHPHSSLPASPIPCPLTASSSSSPPPSLPVPVTLTSSASPAPPTACVPTANGAPHAAMLPLDTQQAANQENSPHAVKPLSVPAEEKGRSALASGLEKLRSTIHPGRSGQLAGPEPERRKSLTEGAGSYYHLTHSELVSLLLRREADLERQRAELERQGTLLGRREAELRRLKPQVRDLEDYIDTLLVRIMEQTPTLLQVRTKLK